MVLFDIIDLYFSYNLISFFFESFKNSKTIIIDAIKYNITQLYIALCSKINSNLIQCKKHVYII